MANRKRAGAPFARWSDAVRRIGVIRKYLATERRGIADADAAAAKLGIGRRAFYHLVRAFEQANRKAPPPRIPSAVELVIDDAIERLGPDARLAETTRAARAGALAAGLAPPAAKTVRLRMANAVMGGSPTGRVIVDHAPLLAAVDDGTGRSAAHATIAIAPGRGVVGLVITSGPPGREAATLAAVEALAALGADAAIETTGDVDAEALGAQLGRTIVPSRRFAVRGSAVGLLMMNRIAGIGFAPRSDDDAILERTAGTPAHASADIELHIRHALRLPLYLPGIRAIMSEPTT